MCNVFDVLLPNTKWYKMWSKCVSHVLIMSCLFNYSVSNIIQTWFLHSSTAGWARTARTKSKMPGINFWTLWMHFWLLSALSGTKSYKLADFRIFLTHNVSCSAWVSPGSNIGSSVSTSSVPLAMVWFMDGPKDWPVGAFWWSASWAKDDKARTASSFFLDWSALLLSSAHSWLSGRSSNSSLLAAWQTNWRPPSSHQSSKLFRKYCPDLPTTRHECNWQATFKPDWPISSKASGVKGVTEGPAMGLCALRAAWLSFKCSWCVARMPSRTQGVPIDWPLTRPKCSSMHSSWCARGTKGTSTGQLTQRMQSCAVIWMTDRQVTSLRKWLTHFSSLPSPSHFSAMSRSVQ